MRGGDVGVGVVDRVEELVGLADGALAEAAFAEALRIAPEDGPARVFLTRIAAFRAAPPPADPGDAE